MTEDDIKMVVLHTLSRIAPEMEGQELNPDTSFRDQLDIDSMDFLNFVIALHETLNIDVPESDYPKLSSLNGCIAYIGARSETSET